MGVVSVMTGLGAVELGAALLQTLVVGALSARDRPATFTTQATPHHDPTVTSDSCCLASTLPMLCLPPLL
jgi:hypothetical protein